MAIKQTITFETSPAKLYEALTSAAIFAEVTGAPAEIDAQEGGSFSCFGGQITGRNVELVPGKRIVQEWRASPWPEGVSSVVRFDISGSGDESTVTLEHSGYPEGGEEHLESGWHKMYWEPLKKYFS